MGLKIKRHYKKGGLKVYPKTAKRSSSLMSITEQQSINYPPEKYISRIKIKEGCIRKNLFLSLDNLPDYDIIKITVDCYAVLQGVTPPYLRSA